MSDLISIQDVIDDMDSIDLYHQNKNGEMVHETWYKAEDVYEALRNVQAIDRKEPERKTGKWDFMGFQMFQCSNCKHTFKQDYLEGWRAYTYEPIFPPFCLNCGAKMEVEE